PCVVDELELTPTFDKEPKKTAVQGPKQRFFTLCVPSLHRGYAVQSGIGRFLLCPWVHSISLL
ncbi:hypothetical protein, partial [Acidaminococcus timonensis]|uniref:hypothetical protein n=1 Tax=Acidaminococcus timonensis TaxID=1871002 RepID=UPI0029436F66